MGGWGWFMRSVKNAGRISAAVYRMDGRGAVLDVGKLVERLLDF